MNSLPKILMCVGCMLAIGLIPFGIGCILQLSVKLKRMSIVTWFVAVTAVILEYLLTGRTFVLIMGSPLLSIPVAVVAFKLLMDLGMRSCLAFKEGYQGRKV